MNSKVTINGHTYEVGPNDVVFVIGDKLHLNFQVMDSGVRPEVNLEGEPLNIHSVGAINVNGNVQGSVHTQGSVKCQNVGKDVKTQGKVDCGGVAGDVQGQGSVSVTGDCGDIKTMGSVNVGGNVKGAIKTMGKVTVGKA